MRYNPKKIAALRELESWLKHKGYAKQDLDKVFNHDFKSYLQTLEDRDILHLITNMVAVAFLTYETSGENMIWPPEDRPVVPTAI